MNEPSITCAVCGTVNEAGARFCEQCGARLRPGGVPGDPAVPPAAQPPLAERRAAPSDPLPVPGVPERPPTVPPPLAPPVGRGSRVAAGTAGTWFRTAPPQTIVTTGLVILLAACVLTLGGQGDLPGGLDLLAFCAGPIGFVVLVIGLVRMALRRPERRF